MGFAFDMHYEVKFHTPNPFNLKTKNRFGVFENIKMINGFSMMIEIRERYWVRFFVNFDL